MLLHCWLSKQKKREKEQEDSGNWLAPYANTLLIFINLQAKNGSLHAMPLKFANVAYV